MAKVKVELEQSEWQLLLMLAGRGYTELGAKLAEQLNAQIEMAAPPPPPGNGEDRSAATPPRQ